jgi:hypothetical protein
LPGDDGRAGASDGVAAFVLRLEPRDGAPVRGTIAPVGDDGAVLRFDGWVELMSAVETLRVRETPSPSS